MKRGFLSVIFGLFAQGVVSKPAANSQITPAPLVKRDQAFIGFYSSVIGGSVVWTAGNCASGSRVITSSTFWRCCGDTFTACSFYTSCSGSMVYAPGLPAYDCNSLAYRNPSVLSGTTYVTNAFCTSNVQYSSLGATSAQVEYVCDTPGGSGTAYYISTTSATPTTSSSSSSSTSQTTPTPPPTSSPPPSKKEIGPIVGGVVGGLAIVAGAAIAMFWICARNRRKATTQPHTVAGVTHAPGYSKTEAESLSPQTNTSGWNAGSPTTLNDAHFPPPNARMSPSPTSGNPNSAAMYMPQPMHQVPIHDMHMQQAPTPHLPGQPVYHGPPGGAAELASRS